MKKLSFVMLFLLVVMAGCSNYDTYIETGMQSLKDEKYSDATMWFKKQKKRNQEMKRNHIKKLLNDHGATALKDGKYLKRKTLQMKCYKRKKMMNLKKL